MWQSFTPFGQAIVTSSGCPILIISIILRLHDPVLQHIPSKPCMMTHQPADHIAVGGTISSYCKFLRKYHLKGFIRLLKAIDWGKHHTIGAQSDSVDNLAVY
jgi:hypothetical protein